MSIHSSTIKRIFIIGIPADLIQPLVDFLIAGFVQVIIKAPFSDFTFASGLSPVLTTPVQNSTSQLNHHLVRFLAVLLSSILRPTAYCLKSRRLSTALAQKSAYCRKPRTFLLSQGGMLNMSVASIGVLPHTARFRLAVCRILLEPLTPLQIILGPSK